MFDKESIQQLSKAEAISAAREAINGHGIRGVVGLPQDFTPHDLEKHLPTRRRLRGTMITSVVAEFATYARENAEPGARVFVSPKTLKADAVLNIGTPAAPGHADNRATLELQRTAAYQALGVVTTGAGLHQRQVAEYLEDWMPIVKCWRDGAEVSTPQAIAAVRKITIEALRKLESEEQQLSASRTTLEQVRATSDHTLPTLIEVRTAPFAGMAERTFGLRLGIQTGGDKPTIVLRVVNVEKHAEEMAAELAALVREAIGTSMPVILGSYEAKA